MYCMTPCTGRFPTLESFFAAEQAGDAEAVERFESYLSNLALGICSLVAIHDLPIILCGEISEWLEPYFQRLLDKVNHLTGRDFPAVIQLGHYGGNAAAIGAACLWHKKFLTELV